MNSSVVLIGYDRIHVHILDTSENVLLNLRIDLFQLCYEILYLHSLRYRSAVGSAGSAGIRKLACALYEMQAVIVAPVLYIRFTDEVKRSYQLHSVEIRTVKFRHHGLHLSAVKHTHEYSFDNIVEVMSKSYLVAAQFLCSRDSFQYCTPNQKCPTRIYAPVYPESGHYPQ